MYSVMRQAERDAVVLREPLEAEWPALAELCFRSKAVWGYDASFMEACRHVLRIDPALAGRGLAQVAVVGEVVVGVAQVSIEGAEAELDLMFVEPERQGLGAGRHLFRWAVEAARREGARRLLILSDPGARPFYERMGARYLRMAPSDAIPGRELPLLAFAL